MGGVVRRAVVATGALGVVLGSVAGVARAAQVPVLGWSPANASRAYNYLTVHPGETASQVFTLTNSGGPASSAVKIKLTGSAAFTTTADSCTGQRLGAGASCTVTVQFAPASYGESDTGRLIARGGVATARVTLHGKAAKAVTRLASSPSAGGPVGSTVTDTATLSRGSAPTGTITFALYGPSATADCSTAAVDTEQVTVSGDGSYTTPAGAAPARTGTYWWTVRYSGDAQNNSATSACGSERVSVVPDSPGITTTQQPATAGLGSTVADQATVTGGDSPTGTVTFTLYGNDSCNGSPLFTDTETLSGGSATSASYTAAALGTDYWVAAYSGDTNNNPVTAPCASEPVTITLASPGISTTQQPATAGLDSAVADQATVTGGDSPTGTVTFTLYGNDSCSGSPLFTDTETLSGGSATSASYTATAMGTDYWVAAYSGDTNNNPVTAPCASEPVTITKASPGLTTTPSPGGGVGTRVDDTALVSGGDDPTGTITFNLYGPSSTADCSTPAVDTEQVSVSGDGGYFTPDGAAPAQPGTYWWTASYGGDADNAATASSCGTESVTLQDKVYWTDYGAGGNNGDISESNLDGTGVTALVTRQDSPVGVAVGNGQIYWANNSLSTTAGTIMTSNLDGSNATALVTGQDTPYGVAVDGSHVYWANQISGTIMEANLDGSGVTTLVTGQQDPEWVAVDASHLYWTAGPGTIMESGLDGTGVTALVTGQNGLAALTVDSSHLYWTDMRGGTIMQANLDGTGVTTLVTGQASPQGIAVDSNHLYWSDPAIDTVMESNLDGTGVTTLVTGQNIPTGMAVSP